jgi:hypothetical protein
MGIVCTRSQQYDAVSATSQRLVMPLSLENPNASGVLPASSERIEQSAFLHDAPLSFHHPSVVNQGEEIPMRLPPTNDSTSQTAVLGQIPRGKELKDLVQLYFSSVHRESLLLQSYCQIETDIFFLRVWVPYIRS